MRRYIYYLMTMWLAANVVSCGHRPDEGAAIVRVKCDTVKTATLPDYLQFPARVKAAEEVNLAFKVSGELMRVFAQEGKHVRQGELLAEIDPRDYAIQLQAVEAEWKRVNAEAERVIALYADSVATASDYDKARYGLQQMTAKREYAQNQLADTKLYAPFDGYVKHCLFDPPAVVGAGMPVVTMYSSSMPEVEIFIPSSAFRRWGDVASFKMKFDFLKEAVPLSLVCISPNVNSNQLYAVRLALPSSMEEQPSVGMSAMVEVGFRATSDDVVEIPANAIFHEDGSDYVWILAGDKVVKRPIGMTQLHTDGTATVTSGLEAGEIVVSAGVDKLRENQQVKPLPQASKTNVGGLL